jgi:predicted amidophosphoribosyltransferase
MKICSHCRLEIPTAAQVCPGCLSDDPGANFTGWFSTLVEYVLGAMLILGIIFWILA